MQTHSGETDSNPESDTVKFALDDLQEVYEKARPYLDRHVSQLNSMSRDIRQFEDLLRAKHVFTDARVEVSETEFVAWTQVSEKPKRMGLVMETYRHINLDLVDDEYKKEVRPLSDMPVAARLRGYGALPELLRDIFRTIEATQRHEQARAEREARRSKHQEEVRLCEELEQAAAADPENLELGEQARQQRGLLAVYERLNESAYGDPNG